jgi:ubiquinone/menaquinone biosynthesis C-methylase UbiE
VATTGWVLHRLRGKAVSLADFVATGDAEAPLYLNTFELGSNGSDPATMVEIGSGIGRMTCAFTRQFATVYACDLDAGFLEHCREVVRRFGDINSLRTVPVPDGRTLGLPDSIADVTFSYLTLQHCRRDDALALVREAVRVTKPGGTIALNFRTRSVFDSLLLPLGRATRGTFQVPGIGDWLSRQRLPMRLAWQLNRMTPNMAIAPVASQIVDASIWRNPHRSDPIAGVSGVELRYLGMVNPLHWWLVAKVAGDGQSPADE